jgi:hypothetical protein
MFRYLRPVLKQTGHFWYSLQRSKAGSEMMQISYFSSSIADEKVSNSNGDSEKPPKRRWKIIKTRDKKPLIQQQRQRNSLLEKKATEMKLEWRIMGAT